MSSQIILQQIKNSHSLLPASRDPPWQEFQQTETFAIALSQKPGFYDRFCIKPRYLGRNPVSLTHARFFSPISSKINK